MVKQLDKLFEQYTNLQGEERKLQEEVRTLKDALDSHTDENHAKRKIAQDRRDTVVPLIEALGKDIQNGRQMLAQLYSNAETNIELAEFAVNWSFKELEPKTEKVA